jgi:ABC-2 type transport system permease protein
MVSSRVNDPRVAEQISGALVLPVVGLIFAQLAGILVLNMQLMLTVAAALAVIDVILIYFGARLFQREVILTRWK